jgi:predicted nucleic acid-binding protein
MMKTHILDANALYRFLIGGPGAEIVAKLLREARDSEQPLRMSVVNWGEVYYTIARVKGFDETAKIIERVKMLPIQVVDADEPVTTRAARLKAAYGLPYADCFAAAITGPGEILITSDVKDFRKIPQLKILPLPPHKV